MSQAVSAGIKGGVPFGDAFTVDGVKFSFPASTQHWIFGGMLEVHLPLGLSVEGDILYRRYTISDSGGEWQFPIIAKYHFLPGPIKPYVGAGPNFNHISGFGNLFSGAKPHAGTGGFVMEGGIEFKALRLRIAPELRYTHWGNANIDLAAINGGIRTSQNQTMFLIGLSF